MYIVKNKSYSNLIKSWLFLLITLLITMIIVGGLTRLTNSGLSITKWEIFTGILPPLSTDRWNTYFSLYKQIPQFLMNTDMTMREFKYIFLWEYYHRLLGRIIGLVFLIPLIIIIYKKIINFKFALNLILIFFLISFQGFMGWYMVKSGLSENISVSHYRLAVHLFIAFIILSNLFWIYLNLNKMDYKNFFLGKNFNSFKFFILLIYLQIILGAFVSGLDAGKVYQTWPLMGDSFFPNDLNLNNMNDIMIFESHSFVQFIHRNLAYLIFIFAIFLGYNILKSKNNIVIKHYFYLMFSIFVQILLGIAALLSDLHLLIASFHQLSSIVLIILTLNLYHRTLR